MFGKTLNLNKILWNARLNGVAAIAALTFVAVPSWAADTSQTSVAPADSSALVKTPDSAAAIAADSIGAADESAAIADAVDTLPVADTSLAVDTVNTIDTSSSVAFADPDTALTGRADTGTVDTAISAWEETETIKKNGAIRFIADNMVYMLFFGISIAVIIVTIIFFARRQDTRRFLTTTRLSVLDKMVQKGCRYIESNYADPELTVSAVCRELVTGEAYLDTLFVKEIGIDVHDFIARVRVNRIKNILSENPSSDIETVYRQCGYTDKATADRHFAKLCGGVGMEVYAKSLVSAGKTPTA